MQMIIPKPDMGGNCLTAVAPVVAQGEAAFDAAGTNTGSTAVAMATIATGSNAPYSGIVTSTGCARMMIEIDYLQGDDCDPCTDPDALTVITETIYLPANSTFSIPQGFWTEVRATVVNSANAALDLVGTQTARVDLYSEYKPACASCVVVAP